MALSEFFQFFHSLFVPSVCTILEALYSYPVSIRRGSLRVAGAYFNVRFNSCCATECISGPDPIFEQADKRLCHCIPVVSLRHQVVSLENPLDVGFWVFQDGLDG